MIVAKNIFKSFGNNRVIRGIDLAVKGGESLAIIGGSGCGKSVLIKCLLGLMELDKGNVTVLGNDTSTNKGRNEAFKQCGMLFQGSALFDDMPVWQNICFALLQTREVSERKAKEIAIQTLAKVNLAKSTAELYPAELSGGMQKRVGLARAIVKSPKLLFFDEPTTGLDPVRSSVINKLIAELVKMTKAAAVTITHDMKSVDTIAQRVVMLHQGKVVWGGSVKKLKTIKNPMVQQFVNGSTNGPLTNL